jgi:G3E family GTPase
MKPIPVTVLTGFLGSGKTTLLNRILTERHGRKIAVIENEFGEVGIDDKLVIHADEEIFAMNNGCLCCTVRGDLVRILQKLGKRSDIEAVLIETTGLADPAPVAQTFFTVPDVAERFRLDGIVALVDARHVSQHLDEGSEEAQKQIAFADVLLLNKTDLVGADELNALEQRVRRMNGAAHLHRTVQADVSIDRILDIGGFNLERAGELDPRFLEPEYPFEWGGAFALAKGTAELTIRPGPDPEMDVVLLPIRDLEAARLDAAREAAVLSFSDEEVVVLSPGDALLATTERQRLTFPRFPARFPIRVPHDGHYALFTQHHPSEFDATLASAPDAPALAPAWEHAFKPDHEHDDAVTSVGITLRGELDGEELNRWLGLLLRVKGADIFRAKGVLSIRGSSRRLLFQGVHMLFDGRFDRPWGPNEERVNQFVFIGRNLDREVLQRGFDSCLAT